MIYGVLFDITYKTS